MLKKYYAICFALLLLPASMLLAQTGGTILGTITDSSGAVVVGATITITNVARGTSQTTVTDGSGDYVTPFVPPGNYQVKVTKPGFQTAQSQVTEVNVDQRVRFDFALRTGSVQQTIEVTSAAPLLQTDSAAMGGVIGKAPVENLPLNGRDFANLTWLVPGVTQGIQNSNVAGNSSFNPRASSDYNALGAQDDTSAWLVDGISDNEFSFNTVLLQPSVESISEFKVLTGIYSAEYGRGSGVVTTQTQSGSNQWHGQAFEFYRTADLDARLYFNGDPQVKPGYIRNQFGSALGGPIKKDKLFFFMDYFGYTINQGVTFVNTVPTMSDRAGNFQDQLANGVVIYDPTSTTTVGGVTTRTPIGGTGANENIIPAGEINAIGSTIANLYPAPTSAGLINNYTYSFPNSTVDNGGVTRIDYKIGNKDSMFGRYSYERWTAVGDKGECCIPTTAAERAAYDLGPFLSGGQLTTLLAHGLALNETHIFSSSLVNQVIAGYSHFNPFTTQSDYGLDGADKLGITGINVAVSANRLATSGVPTFQISQPEGSYTDIDDGNDFLPSNPRDTVYQLEDDLSWVKGTQQITTGYRILKQVMSPYSNTETRGFLYFGLNLTNNPATASGGNGLASLLLGLMANGTSPGASRGFFENIPVDHTYEQDAYVQDNWTVKPNLTLNLGVRWDYYPFYTEKSNKLTNFDPTTNTLIYAGQNGVSSRVGEQSPPNDFSPRIGLSWGVPGHGIIVHTGYAISYTPEEPSASEMLDENVPWVISQTTAVLPLYPTAAQLAADPLLSAPFSAPTASQPTTTAALQALAPAIVADTFSNKTPSFQNWTLNIQKQFAGNFMAEIGYVGSRSEHLLWDPNYQEVEPGPSSTPEVDRVTIPAIYPVTSVTYSHNINFVNYQALTAELQKRLSRGLEAITSFTWSHALDEGSAAATGGGYDGNPQTITDRQAGYGPTAYDIPLRLVQSWDWDLPVGPGHALLNKGVLGNAIGGWQFDGIMTLQSGYPFTIGNMSSCPNNAGNCWPDLVGNPRNFSNDPKGTHQTYANWYNPAAFAVPCQVAVTATGACSTPAYRYGTAPRGIMRGPQTANFDLSMAKIFHVWESANIQFRVDAFDAFNHPVLGVPNTTINSTDPASSSTAITATEADGRDLQGSLQLRF